MRRARGALALAAAALALAAALPPASAAVSEFIPSIVM
jgi:hypothetical protein